MLLGIAHKLLPRHTHESVLPLWPGLGLRTLRTV